MPPNAIGQKVAEGFIALRATQTQLVADIHGTSAMLKAKLGMAGAQSGAAFGAKFALGFKAAMATASTAILGAGVAALAAGVAGGAAFTGWGVKLAAEAEQAEIAFTTMLNSGTKAKKLIGELRTFAAKTPFEFSGLREAASNLLAMGVNSNDVIPTLTRLGDVASGLGLNLSEIATLYGQMKVQQKLYTGDLRQWTTRGVPLIQEIAKQFKVTEAEVLKLAETGKISFKNLEQAFISLTGAGSQFGGLMDKQSRSLSGQFSTMKDTISEVALSIGQEFMAPLKMVSEMMGSLLGNTKATVAEFVKGFGETLMGVFRELGSWIAKLIEGMDFLSKWLDLNVAGWQYLISEIKKGKAAFDLSRGAMTATEASVKMQEIENDPALVRAVNKAMARDEKGAIQTDSYGRVLSSAQTFKWGERAKQWGDYFDSTRKKVTEEPAPKEPTWLQKNLAELRQNTQDLTDRMLSEVGKNLLGHTPGELLAAGAGATVKAMQPQEPKGFSGFTSFEGLNKSIQESLLQNNDAKVTAKNTTKQLTISEKANEVLKDISEAAMKWTVFGK